MPNKARFNIASVFAAAGLAAAAGGAFAADAPVIGLITKTDTNPFFVKMKEGAQAAAKEQGAKLLSAAGKADGDNAGQVTAIENMIAGGAKRIRRIFVTGPGAAPVTPCGGCRQRIREFADLDTPVICLGVAGRPLETTLGELLPHSFGPEFLGP